MEWAPTNVQFVEARFGLTASGESTMSVLQYDWDSYLADTLAAIRGLDDPDYGPAESWPSWTDEDIWTIGPEPQPLEPEPAGEPAYEPTDADWDEMARYCEWADRVEAMHCVTDDDLRAAGLPVG
jgi:hypothetical protein